MSSEEGVPVDLYIYDLSHGLAPLLSPALIGRAVEGVWHTAVVVFGREFFYGGGGVASCAPGGTALGAPHRVERLGATFVPFPVFADYLQALATTAYTGAQYRLLEHNCNHFSEEVVQFLCGAHVPKHVVAQPERDLPPPLRRALLALLESLAPAGVLRLRRDSPDFLTLNTQIEEARAASAELEARRSTLAEKLARKERRREKKRRKQRAGRDHDHDHDHDDDDEMAEALEAELAVSVAGPSAGAGAGAEADVEADAEELRRRARDPPVVYRDIDGAAEFEKLALALEGAQLSPEERQSLDELQQYLVQGEGSWVLGDDFLAFIGRVLGGEAAAAGAAGAAREAALRCLAAGALRDDVALLLHQDRRHHALLSYAHDVDRHPPAEQLPLALFMCNLFEHAASSEWLLYISEWEARGRQLSNIRVTTKVCVHCLLSEEAALRDAGSALLYNIATKEVKTVRLRLGAGVRRRLPHTAKIKVFDEVCVELCMAALQLLGGGAGGAGGGGEAADEAAVWRTLAALARLAAHSPDVPQLIAMVGPDPAAYRGTSARVDEQIELIARRLK